MRTKSSSDLEHRSWHPADRLRLAFLLFQELLSGDADACENFNDRQTHEDTGEEVLHVGSAGGSGQGAADDAEKMRTKPQRTPF